MCRLAQLSLGTLILFLTLMPCGIVWGQRASDPNNLISEVQIGFGGTIRIGHWVPIQIQTAKQRIPSDVRLELETLDSDAVPVVFQSEPVADDDGWIRGLICVGRVSAGLSIRLVDANGQILASKTYPRLADSHTVIPATERILLQLGSPLNLPKLPVAGRSLQERRIAISDSRALPVHWFEYDSVDAIVFATGGSENIATKMSPEQIDAMWRWLNMGGRILFSVGENAQPLVSNGSPFEKFAPGTFRETSRLSSSDSLEFYAGAAAGQLIVDPASQSLPVALFESATGMVEVRQGNVPLVVRRNVGFGDLVFVCFDLEEPLIVDWKGNGRLLGRLTGNTGAETGLVRVAPKTLEANYGFRDLSGQVRAAGERFRGVGIVSFVLVAALIVLYAICLGPLDYLFLNRFVRRMEWTWVTSTVMIVAFGGLAWGMVRLSKPNTILLNRTEIVDLNAANGAARGGVWTSIYSPHTDSFDLKFPVRDGLGIDLQTGLTSSLGLAGDGVGGMESRTVTQMFRQPYTVSLTHSGNQALTHVEHAPVAVASTKQFFSKWDGTHSLRQLGEISFQETGRQLVGTIRNPLQHDLHDAVVLYGNTVYLLGDVPAESSVDLSSGTERSLKYFLQSADSSSEAARWTTGDRRIPRVFDMLMFFRVAGGEDFTGLSNDYQNELDLSEALALGNAIFTGRVDGDSDCPLEIAGGAHAPDIARQTTFLRVVLPVQIVGPTRK